MKIIVPGVNKILGAFTTFCRGLMLCTVDNKQLVADFKKRSDGYVKILVSRSGECKKFQTGNTKIKKEDKFFNAVKGVYAVIGQQYPDLPGYDIVLDGDLLDCEGHIVYSAIAIATVKALFNELKIQMSLDDIIRVTINALKYASEIGNVGDIVTILAAKKDQFVVYNGVTRKYKIFDNPFKGSAYELLVVDGHVPTGPMKEEASARRKDLIESNQLFMNLFPDVSSVSPVEFRSRVSNMDEDIRFLCTYLYEETKAVLNIEKIVEDRNIETIGHIFAKIRNLADEYLELICPEMDWVAKRACETRGCVGATTFFEGYCTKVAIIIKKESEETLRSNISEYQHIFGFDLSIDVIG